MSLSIGIHTKIFKTLHACLKLFRIGVNKLLIFLTGAKSQVRVTYICIMYLFRFECLVMEVAADHLAQEQFIVTGNKRNVKFEMSLYS